MTTVRALAIASVPLLWGAGAAAQTLPLEMRIPAEQVPPGGVLQAKVEITEPRPISTGSSGYDLGSFSEFLGLAVHSPNGDAAAAGVVRGSRIHVRLVSPSGLLGTDPDYPILTMTVRAPATAPLGTRVPLALAGSTVFLDPLGVPYPVSFRAGEAVIAPGPSIANVSPGSATVPADGTVTIEGIDFAPDAEVRISETPVTATRVVDSQRIDVVVGRATTMHGREVQVRHPSTNEETSYFAYQRTTPLGTSQHPLFRAVEPAFPQRFHTAAVIRFEAPKPSSAYGIALQNLGAPVQVSLELRDASGRLGVLTAVLGANTQSVRSLAEAFGASCGAVCVVRVSATGPIQVMGLAGDLVQDAVTPLLPVPDATLELRTTANASTYRAGDNLVLHATLTAGLLPTIADAYVVLRQPSGTLLSLTPGGLAPGLVPFARSVATGAAGTWELLRTVVPAGAPPAAYLWLTALAEPGTLNLLTPVASTPFSVQP